MSLLVFCGNTFYLDECVDDYNDATMQLSQFAISLRNYKFSYEIRFHKIPLKSFYESVHKFFGFEFLLCQHSIILPAKSRIQMPYKGRNLIKDVLFDGIIKAKIIFYDQYRFWILTLIEIHFE